MKAAANDFVDNLIDGSGNIRIAIVTINGGGTQVAGALTGFSSDASELHSAINGISTDYATNLQSGLYVARGMIAGSTAENKSVVLMSDGQPNYSYKPEVDPPELVGEDEENISLAWPITNSLGRRLGYAWKCIRSCLFP